MTQVANRISEALERAAARLSRVCGVVVVVVVAAQHQFPPHVPHYGTHML